MNLQEQLVQLRATLEKERVDEGLTIEWEPATNIWLTARLRARLGDSEVLVFEDLDEIVLIPPGGTYPRAFPFEKAENAAAAIFQMLGR